MIEDELRTLLASRADEVPDNAARVTQVRSRIGAVRRRRTAGTVLGLVLLAVAGVALTRLPGRPDALPTAVPAGLHFDQIGRPSLPGYEIESIRQLDGPQSDFYIMNPQTSVRRLLVVRCQRAGTLVVRNVEGPSMSVDCSQPVGGRFEGAVRVEPDEAVRLFAQTSADVNMSFEPSTPGRWDFAVLAAIAPDRLPPWDVAGIRPLVAGAGSTVPVTIPAQPPRTDPEIRKTYGFGLTADCVEGVVLTLAVPTGTLATLTCDQRHGLSAGRVQGTVTLQDMARLGLRAGDRVRLTVRSTGRQTDQWRLWPLGP